MPSRQRLAVRPVRKPTNRTRAVKKKKIVTFVPKIHSSEDDGALFYMFTYKIGTQRRHVNIHCGMYNYGITKCEHMFKSGRCPKGRECRFAHSSLELLFHPLFYKTKECSALKRGKCPQGEECAFAHNAEEMRDISWDWRTKDPVSYSEKKEIWDKKARKKSKRVRLRQPIARVVDEDEKEKSVDVDEAAPSVSSSEAARMSVSSSPADTPHSPETAATEDMMSVSTSVSPALKETEEEDDVNATKEVEASAVTKDVEFSVADKRGATGQAFAKWYRHTFNCEFLSYVHYLTQFQVKELDDVELLWDLYIESRKKKNNSFGDMLVNEISMVDEVARSLFVRRLCEYKSPVDIRGWMERVVGLPQYVDLFVASVGEGGRVDDLVHLGVDSDDLAEIGVSLVGHRMKILHELKKFGEFDWDV